MINISNIPAQVPGKVAIFGDIENVMIEAHEAGFNIDWAAFIKDIGQRLGEALTHRMAYATWKWLEDKIGVPRLMRYFRKAGFEVISPLPGRNNADNYLIADAAIAIKEIEGLTTLILMTNDVGYLRLVEKAKKRGIKVILFYVGRGSWVLRNNADEAYDLLSSEWATLKQPTNDPVSLIRKEKGTSQA